jgi:hypothetical protein
LLEQGKRHERSAAAGIIKGELHLLGCEFLTMATTGRHRAALCLALISMAGLVVISVFLLCCFVNLCMLQAAQHSPSTK